MGGGLLPTQTPEVSIAASHSSGFIWQVRVRAVLTHTSGHNVARLGVMALFLSIFYALFICFLKTPTSTPALRTERTRHRGSHAPFFQDKATLFYTQRHLPAKPYPQILGRHTWHEAIHGRAQGKLSAICNPFSHMLWISWRHSYGHCTHRVFKAHFCYFLSKLKTPIASQAIRLRP